MLKTVNKGNMGIVKHFVWIMVSLVFLLKAVVFLDPDFGWRLKTGEYILENGVPKVDLYSYSMPSFPFVDHAWLVDALIALVYSRWGMYGISIIFSLVMLFTILIVWLTIIKQVSKYPIIPKTLKTRFGLISFFPLLLLISVFFTFFGVRAQVFTWLFFSILLYLLYNAKVWLKLRYFVPFLFLLWANVHGGFASGLALLGLHVSIRDLRFKKITWINWVVFSVSTLITLVNPYELGTWREIWSSVSDSHLRWAITEWMPAFLMLDFAMVLMLALTGLFAWKFKGKYKLEHLAIFLFFLFQAMLSRRHVPIWMITAIPVSVEGFLCLYQESVKFKFGKERFYTAYKVLFIIAILIVIFQTVVTLRGSYGISENSYYPVDALSYLKINKPKGNIFSEYGWGGYIIWKLPGQKVFIDGRMPSWKWDPPNSHELAYAFERYSDIRTGEEQYGELFDKFNITTVLLLKNQKNGLVSELDDKVYAYIRQLQGKSTIVPLIVRLEKDGWFIIYEDDLSVLYEKP